MRSGQRVAGNHCAHDEGSLRGEVEVVKESGEGGCGRDGDEVKCRVGSAQGLKMLWRRLELTERVLERVRLEGHAQRAGAGCGLS